MGLAAQDTPSDLFERRCLYFSTAEGHNLFQERIRRRISGPRFRSEVICDTEIEGPWSEYASVWRVLIRPCLLYTSQAAGRRAARTGPAGATPEQGGAPRAVSPSQMCIRDSLKPVHQVAAPALARRQPERVRPFRDLELKAQQFPVVEGVLGRGHVFWGVHGSKGRPRV